MADEGKGLALAAAVFALRTQAIHHRAQATLHEGLARSTDAMADRVERGEKLDPQGFHLKVVVDAPDDRSPAPEVVGGRGMSEQEAMRILEAAVARVENSQIVDTVGLAADVELEEELVVKYLQKLQDDNYVTRRAGKGNEWFVTSKARQAVSRARVEP